MLPSPAGRTIRVARNPAEKQWMLVIGPSVSRATVKEKEELARESAAVQQLQQKRDDLLARAAELEAEAKNLRKGADTVGSEIAGEIRKAIGPDSPFTETYDFQCNAATDKKLAKLSQKQLVDRLLEARGKASAALKCIERGYWGDMTLLASLPISGGGGGGWTKVGSPDWLQELFPDLEAAP